MIWLGLGAALSAAARQDREEEKRGLEERALSLELLVLGFVASRRALAELLETPWGQQRAALFAKLRPLLLGGEGQVMARILNAAVGPGAIEQIRADALTYDWRAHTEEEALRVSDVLFRLWEGQLMWLSEVIYCGDGLYTSQDGSRVPAIQAKVLSDDTLWGDVSGDHDHEVLDLYWNIRMTGQVHPDFPRASMDVSKLAGRVGYTSVGLPSIRSVGRHFLE